MNHMILQSVTNKMNIKRPSVSAIAIGAFDINALLIRHNTSLDSVSNLSGGWVPCHTPMGSPVTRGRRLVERPILAYDFSETCVRMPIQNESVNCILTSVAEVAVCCCGERAAEGVTQWPLLISQEQRIKKSHGEDASSQKGRATSRSIVYALTSSIHSIDHPGYIIAAYISGSVQRD